MSFTNVSVISFTKQFWVGWNLRPKMSATAAAMVGNKRKNVNVLDRYTSEKKSTKETNLRKLGTDEGIKIKVWWVKGEREKKTPTVGVRSVCMRVHERQRAGGGCWVPLSKQDDISYTSWQKRKTTLLPLLTVALHHMASPSSSSILSSIFEPLGWQMG